MKESIRFKLEQLKDRYEEVSALLSDADVINDQNRFKELSKEFAELEPVVKCFNDYTSSQDAIEEAEQLLKDPDPDMREMAKEELEASQSRLEALDSQLQILLLPKDPHDQANIFLEIRAGTGGDEAAIFAGDLFKMYSKFAESKRWRVEVISENPGEHGGYKEIIARITGENIYSQLKFESGAHRVQRVPETESQGRVHTSACTVAVMPEVEEVEEFEINAGDLRVDTYRASGAGGQHVNKTDSAIRLTHLPTGIVVECQDERSQHKNRAKAMSLLQAKLLRQSQEQQAAEQAQTRKSLVGSGDRSEKIRTYNYPQGRITDHRIKLTLYKLEEVIQGDLESVIEPLVREHQAELLASLGN